MKHLVWLSANQRGIEKCAMRRPHELIDIPSASGGREGEWGGGMIELVVTVFGRSFCNILSLFCVFFLLTYEDFLTFICLFNHYMLIFIFISVTGFFINVVV